MNLPEIKSRRKGWGGPRPVEAASDIFMNLQSKRCKDPDVAAKIDALQNELVAFLCHTLKGYRTEHDLAESGW
jgi:hypothetical protein